MIFAFVHKSIENIVGKVENIGYQNDFKRLLHQVIEIWDCVVRG